MVSPCASGGRPTLTLTDDSAGDRRYGGLRDVAIHRYQFWRFTVGPAPLRVQLRRYADRYGAPRLDLARRADQTGSMAVSGPSRVARPGQGLLSINSAAPGWWAASRGCGAGRLASRSG